MTTRTLTTLMLAASISLSPIWAGDTEADATPQATTSNKLSQEDWQKLMSRIRNYEESAMTELMDIVNSKRCPGTAEELVSMLKIAAGMGEKRAQTLLAECYRLGIGTRRNSDLSANWEFIYNQY